MTAPSIQPSSPSPVSRGQWLSLLVIAIVALGLRFASPERLAVEHFDEGVYASNIWFGNLPEGAYPSQHLYAPPLLPALIEWCFVFSGPSNYAAMWPNQIAGTLTVLLIWWLGRKWFGPLAGLVAAGLCATNEVHLLLSRSALTDVLLGLWWLAAVWALLRASESGSAFDRLAAGLLIALAWYTKYNGWMPLGIVTGAVLARGILCPQIWPATRRAISSCLIAGLIAFATWSPWLWSLESKGGYASVAANHRQYIVGINGWWSSAVRQLEQLHAVQGLISEVTWLVGLAFIGLTLTFASRPTRQQAEVSPAADEPSHIGPPPARSVLDTVFCLGVLTLVLARPFAPVPVTLLLASQGLGRWLWNSTCFRTLRDDNPTDRPVRGDRSDLAYWILSVWFVGLLIATPFYRPYLRLTLPEILATCLAIGLTVQQAADLMNVPGWHRSKSNRSPTIPIPAGVNWLLLLFVVCVGLTRVGFHPSQQLTAKSLFRSIPDQSSLPRGAEQLASGISAGQDNAIPSVVYVYGEPSLLFQLRLAGLENVAPVSSLKFAASQYSTSTVRIYLAVGLHAKSDPKFREQVAAVQPQLRLVGRWPWQLGPLVALDQSTLRPEQLDNDPFEFAVVELFEVLAP